VGDVSSVKTLDINKNSPFKKSNKNEENITIMKNQFFMT